MAILEAGIFGIIQGITNFLPISSEGHVILSNIIFGVSNNTSFAFEAFLYLAIATSIFVYFSTDVWQLTQAFLRKVSKLPVNKRDETLLYSLLVASIPALVIGLTLETIIKSIFSSPFLVAGVLLVGSLFFAYSEWIYQSTPSNNVIDVKKGLKIGLFQTLSLIPGMSSTGATIAGGMLLGLSRVEALRFTLLLAIPIFVGASIQKFILMITSDATVSWVPILFGSTIAFVIGLLTIGFLMKFMCTHTLWPFIWYRIILASFIIFITVFG